MYRQNILQFFPNIILRLSINSRVHNLRSKYISSRWWKFQTANYGPKLFHMSEFLPIVNCWKLLLLTYLFSARIMQDCSIL